MNKVYYLPKFQSGGKTEDKTSKIIKDVGETILDFTPVVGDIKGLTYDPYKAYQEDGWKGGLTMMGLGLLGLIPIFGDVAKKSGKILHSAKKANSWRDQAIYLRHWDLRKEWPNFNEEELQKHVSIKSTEKAKDKYLSQAYHGQYTTSPEEQFTRVNNTSDDRVKWIKEHPVKELPNHTTVEEQIELANRNWANEYLNQFQKALEENVEYSSKKIRKTYICWIWRKYFNRTFWKSSRRTNSYNFQKRK